MTDFRALCEELVETLEGRRFNYVGILDRARAALVEQAVGPTDKVLDQLEVMLWERYKTLGFQGEEFMYEHSFGFALVDFARAVLARWGSHPTPISVAERLPGPEDCDAEGQCWWWDTAAESWILALYAHWTDFTHWLPANALPMPVDD